MNGFAERGTSGSSDLAKGTDGLLTWEAAHARLALVGRIAADIAAHAERQARLLPEKARLDEFRHHLDWARRSRRYELEQEVAEVDKALRQFEAELNRVGAVLLDPATGLVGFPTIVNDRRAFFSWKPGEEGLGFWNYLGDPQRNPVPASWIKPTRQGRPAKGRSRSQR